jgi:two-component system, NtrC family, sensor kinase
VIGRIAAGLAHELGNPLHVVSERAKMARSGEIDADDLPRTLDIIIEQTARIAGTIRQVLDLARPQPPDRSTVNLRRLVDSTQELMAPLAQKRSVQICVAGPEEARVRLDSNQMRQVLMNLVMNALHAMHRPGTIELRLSSQPAEKLWVLDVRDEGAGIEPENLGRLFEPFFTTKPVGEGTGLGLSIAAGIVHEHGGTIQVQSEVGQGSTFTIRLPWDAEPEVAT